MLNTCTVSNVIVIVYVLNRKKKELEDNKDVYYNRQFLSPLFTFPIHIMNNQALNLSH